MLFCAIERKFWESFCRGVDRSDLIDRWSGTDVDFGDAVQLRAELEAVFVTRSAGEWETAFFAWDIPGSVILPIGQVLDHPHTAARGLVHENGETLVSNPLRWHDLDRRPGDEAARPPELGEHTDEVLEQWLG